MHKRTSAPLATAVLLMLAAGCARTGTDPALVARQALLGLPKDVLLSCAGVPHRSAVIDNREWFTYRSDRIVSTPGYPSGPLLYAPPEIDSIACEATFALRNGRVENLSYTSPQSIVYNPQCKALITGCLALTPSGGAPLLPRQP